MGKPREQRLGEVFVSLADTLVAEYSCVRSSSLKASARGPGLVVAGTVNDG
jgi:hypothetical protein